VLVRHQFAPRCRRAFRARAFLVAIVVSASVSAAASAAGADDRTPRNRETPPRRNPHAEHALPASRTAFECFAVRERHGAAVVAGAELAVELAPGCRVKTRATLACAPAASSLDGTSGVAGERGPQPLFFDRLCYEIRCPGDAPGDAGAARRAAGRDAEDAVADEKGEPVVIDDHFGPRVVRRFGHSMVCTPASITPLVEGAEGSERARGDAPAVGAAVSVRDHEVQLRTCGDFSGDGAISATDALGVLKSAIGSAACLPCVCDVDKSGAATATDALTVLKKAVGQNVSLNCDPDGNPVSWTGGGDGVSWEDPVNWSLATRIPNLCDDVSIPQTTAPVNHSEGSNGALRVTSLGRLDIDGGTLTLRDTIRVDTELRMIGGTLKDAVVLAPATALHGAAHRRASYGAVGAAEPPRTAMTLTTSGGLLDGVTMEDVMDLSATSANVRIQNDLVLNSRRPWAPTATCGSRAGTRRFQGPARCSSRPTATRLSSSTAAARSPSLRA
jgi:hypothetical protein